MGEHTLQGSLTFLGFAISILGVFYFAMEYIPRVSDWSQLASLITLALFFAFLGVYIRHTVVGQPFFDGPRLAWLRPAVVLFLLALITGIIAEIRFLALDDVAQPLKILISLLIGVGLIVVVAQRRTRQASKEEAPAVPTLTAPPSPAPPSVPAQAPTRAPAKRAAPKRKA